MKNRVTGLGGIFFKTQDPEKIREWYQTHLGLKMSEYGSTFFWRAADNPEHLARTEWSPFKADTQYFTPSEKDFMFNYRVENLVELLEVLKQEGVQIVGEMEEYEYGKFAWILDPEGNKIELWEPIDEVLNKLDENT
jgi:predicted enzyme related to lactoylglutathione lyase